MKNKSNIKLLLTMAAFVLVFSFAISTPITALAKVTYENSSNQSSSTKKDKRYFSDVKKQSKYRKDIEWLAARGAYRGIAKRNKSFKPNKIITRREFGTILDNLYGDKIKLTISGPRSKVTQKFLTNTLETVSDQLGYRVTWNGGAPRAKVTRGAASYYLRLMMKSAEGALDP